MDNLVGPRLRELLRKELNLRQAKNVMYSQKAFARDLGIGKTTLSDTLRGLRTPSYENCEKILNKVCADKAVAKELLYCVRNKQSLGDTVEFKENLMKEIEECKFYLFLISMHVIQERLVNLNKFIEGITELDKIGSAIVDPDLNEKASA